METVDRIKKGFELLKKDCSQVSLVGFADKSEIPSTASKEELDGECFDHEFNLTMSDGLDDCDFWGDVYLPLYDDVYMHFEVHA